MTAKSSPPGRPRDRGAEVKGPAATRPSTSFTVPDPADMLRFPRPSTYGLTLWELCAERRRCRAAGWARWELLYRFGREAA